jgi:hypothetical protein
MIHAGGSRILPLSRNQAEIRDPGSAVYRATQRLWRCAAASVFHFTVIVERIHG